MKLWGPSRYKSPNSEGLPVAFIEHTADLLLFEPCTASAIASLLLENNHSSRDHFYTGRLVAQKRLWFAFNKYLDYPSTVITIGQV
jgi:hypothetical protein